MNNQEGIFVKEVKDFVYKYKHHIDIEADYYYGMMVCLCLNCGKKGVLYLDNDLNFIKIGSIIGKHCSQLQENMMLKTDCKKMHFCGNDPVCSVLKGTPKCTYCPYYDSKTKEKEGNNEDN